MLVYYVLFNTKFYTYLNINIMKKTLIFLTMAALFFSCDNKEEQLQNQAGQLEKLENQNAQLLAENREKDSSMVVLIESFNEIEENLREIRQREMNIELKNREKNLSPADAKRQIQEDINEIERLIAENKQTVQRLNTRLRRTGQESAQLNETMNEMKENLSAQVEEREARIAELRKELGNLESTVAQLNQNLDSLQTANEQTYNQLNTAYYVAGEYKELRDKNILEKAGGFLGLGRTKTLKDNLDPEKFNRIDIRNQTVFPVEGEGIELITHHPANSYKIEKDEQGHAKLVISDPEKFWASSRYMVMEVDK